MVIVSFDKEYRFLSNFYEAKVVYKEVQFYTVENAYQAAKFKDESKISTLTNVSPSYAKSVGSQIEIRDDWNEVKYKIMKDLLNQKFKSNLLFTKLSHTSPCYLIEGNYWHDNYWGVCYCKHCKGIGENRLGDILMEIRSRGILL